MKNRHFVTVEVEQFFYSDGKPSCDGCDFRYMDYDYTQHCVKDADTREHGHPESQTSQTPSTFCPIHNPEMRIINPILEPGVYSTCVLDPEGTWVQPCYLVGKGWTRHQFELRVSEDYNDNICHGTEPDPGADPEWAEVKDLGDYLQNPKDNE